MGARTRHAARTLTARRRLAALLAAALASTGVVIAAAVSRPGPHYISTIYHDPMPWAVFFAPGGVAFHGGSLTVPSHGCVHLTVANAHYYNEHLAVGAEVVVF